VKHAALAAMLGRGKKPFFFCEIPQTAVAKQVTNNKKRFPASKRFHTGGFVLEENYSVYK